MKHLVSLFLIGTAMFFPATSIAGVVNDKAITKAVYHLLVTHLTQNMIIAKNN